MSPRFKSLFGSRAPTLIDGVSLVALTLFVGSSATAFVQAAFAALAGAA